VERVHLPHPELFAALHPGSDVLLNDGQIRLRVESLTEDRCVTRVIFGGELSNHKGVNIPGVALPIAAITEKDRADLLYGLELGVDFVALSFVQRPEDLFEARALIEDRAVLVAKVEKPLAVQRLKEIVHACDAVMIARGDLGVEMHPEDVPSVQKQIIRECRAQGRPVIVATQMLDSMISHPVPTRAEASDVACAVYDGVDAVMLSAESASGQYPIETVIMMNRIIERVESDPHYRRVLDAQHPVPDPTASDAITAAARKIAETLSLKAIVTMTTSGTTTIRASRERPNAPLIGVTPDPLTAHALTLVWGTHPILIPLKDMEKLSFPELMNFICQAMLSEGFADAGDDILVTIGAQFGTDHDYRIFKTGTTRGLYILNVQDPRDPRVKKGRHV
jgi:pyruvate kinase